jgi:diguanylate cyclase (GGDEF)-like protein
LHARVERSPTGFIVHDLGSTNGTFVNDIAIKGMGLLKDGDYLRVGNCIFRFLSGGNVEAEYHEEIYRLIIIDALTQAHNRRAMLEFLDRELTRSHRHHRPVSLLLMDIDHFKSINDKYGHLAGDATLRDFSQIVRSIVRREDLFARYGGEEFALVLVEAGPVEAKEVGERIRHMIETHVFRYRDQEFHVTVSIGVAATTGGESLTTTEMLRRADEKLYEAKRSGRNRVVA